MIETKKYSRRPFDVEAIRVTKANMAEVAEWCKGTVKDVPATETTREECYIQVDVHSPATERQSRAFPGDYVLLLEGGKSFKVYTTKAFSKNFILTDSIVPTKDDSNAPYAIREESREALKRLVESMDVKDEVVDSSSIEISPAQPEDSTPEPESQVEPKLEVEDSNPAVEPASKRKFIQQS